MTSSCHHSKISTNFVLHRKVASKNDDTNVGFGFLNEIKKSEIDYLEHDDMHKKGHKEVWYFQEPQIVC